MLDGDDYNRDASYFAGIVMPRQAYREIDVVPEEGFSSRYDTRPVLSTQERKFVSVYVATSNKRDSAIEAGYDPSRALENAKRLLRQPYIKDAVREMQETICRKWELTTERTVAELRSIAYANIADYTDVVYDAVSGEPIGRSLDVTSMSRADMAAVAEIYHDRYGVRLKMYDKLAALTQLARIQGLNVDPAADKGQAPLVNIEVGKIERIIVRPAPDTDS